MDRPRSPIEKLIDQADMRCTVCNAKMGECDCWEPVIYFEGQPPYHRPGLPGLTLCMDYPWTDFAPLGGKIKRIHAPLEPKEYLCPNCFSEDDEEGLE